MAEYSKRFIVDNNKLKNAYYEGFEAFQGGLKTVPEEGRHIVFLKGLDSGEEAAEWGRLVVNYSIGSEVVVIVRAFASDDKMFNLGDEYLSFNSVFANEALDADLKKAVYNEQGGIKRMNQNDVLLYELKGRYLFLSFEILGGGEGEISGAVVLQPGDNFMQSFPEIFNQRNSFFHRYISIFSSIYNDFQKKIDNVHEYMDIDTTPREFLPMFASWLGLDVNVDSFEEDQLRKLIKQAMYLNRHKGTRAAIDRVVSILVDNEAIIVEKSLISGHISREDKAIYDKLYGKTSFDFTVLLNEPFDEKLRSQLIFLVDQFRPIRSKVNFVFLGDCCTMDSYCYLDVNAKVHEQVPAVIDESKPMNGTVFLA